MNAPLKRRTEEPQDEDVDIRDSRRPNRFQKFSPRRASPSPKAEPLKSEESEGLKPHKFERTAPKEAPPSRKPKDEWLIPEAEQFISKPKKTSKSRDLTRQDSKNSEPKSEKRKSGSELKPAVETVQPPAFNVLAPKILIPVILVVIALGYFLLFSGGKEAKPAMKPQ